jgi:hypothetical protein
MEDSDYRDLMRADLARARKNYGVARSNHGATVLITMILLLAGGAVIMHHMGLIELPK